LAIIQATWYNDLGDRKMNLKSHTHSVQKRMVVFWDSVSRKIQKVWH